MPRYKAFTLVEMLVVVFIIGILIAIIVPRLSRFREQAQRTQSLTQIGGIYKGMLAHSLDNGALEYYPGLDESGEEEPDADTPWYGGTGGDIEARVGILLENNVDPEIFVSPLERAPGVREFDKSQDQGDDVLSNANYSYAFLQVDTAGGGRFAEWKNTTNSQAPVVSDRAVGRPGGIVNSLYPSNDADEWTGGVGYNAGNAKAEGTFELNVTIDGLSISRDSLFESDGDIDGGGAAPANGNAFMIANGNTAATDNIFHTRDPNPGGSTNDPSVDGGGGGGGGI